MKFSFLVFLVIFLTKNALAQLSFGLGLSNGFVHMKSRPLSSIGVTGDLSYQFLNESKELDLNLGLEISFNRYANIDYYNNVYLVNDPSYMADYSQVYLHKTRNLELSVPILCSYVLMVSDGFDLRFGIGINPRLYAYTQSSVFLDGTSVAEGVGLRLTDVNERIKIQDLLTIGAVLNQFEIRLQSSGVILGLFGLNQHYYYFTDREGILSQISLTLRYQL